jgi:Zn ribbon nucleic-acid-binding protein
MEQAQMICPYCNAVFTPKMDVQYTVISAGCDTCGFGEKAEVNIDVFL